MTNSKQESNTVLYTLYVVQYYICIIFLIKLYTCYIKTNYKYGLNYFNKNQVAWLLLQRN